ncbi:MAG: hypothetical protein WC554_06150 [Clostridia bacterium]|jgi:hypothetical protein
MDRELEIHGYINALFYYIKQTPVDWKRIKKDSKGLNTLVEEVSKEKGI